MFKNEHRTTQSLLSIPTERRPEIPTPYDLPHHASRTITPAEAQDEARKRNILTHFRAAVLRRVYGDIHYLARAPTGQGSFFLRATTSFSDPSNNSKVEIVDLRSRNAQEGVQNSTTPTGSLTQNFMGNFRTLSPMDGPNPHMYHVMTPHIRALTQYIFDSLPEYCVYLGSREYIARAEAAWYNQGCEIVQDPIPHSCFFEGIFPAADVPHVSHF